MWIIPLAQAPALARSAKLNAEICLVSIYLIIVIGLFLYLIVALVVCAVPIFNSSSWAAYQSCEFRLEICQKIYTTRFLGQKFYTLKVRKLRRFLLKKKQRKCIDISYFGRFFVRI